MDRGARRKENLRGQQDQQRPPESQMAAHQHQPPPPQKCPRCDSSNTKFCYYNNYSLSQPRYFCKACRRYWTQGGTLRNVPIGGGSRKGKRSKTSSSSLFSSEIARTQCSSLPSQNMFSGQSMRPLSPAAIPPMGNSFYSGGGPFLSSLSAMQSLPRGGPVAVNLGRGGANMTILQGISFPRPPSAYQFQPQNDFFPSQQSLIPPRALSSWTPSLIYPGAAAATSSNFWSCNIADGRDQAGSSFSPNQWSDNHPGFDPSQ